MLGCRLYFTEAHWWEQAVMLSDPHWIWAHSLCSSRWVPVAIRGLTLSTQRDRQTDRKISPLTVPTHWPPFLCLLLPPCIAVTHPKNSDLPTEVIEMSLQKPFQGISRLLLSLLPTPRVLPWFRHSGRGRGSRANRNTVFLLPQESWRACKSHWFVSPAPGDLWWPGSH